METSWARQTRLISSAIVACLAWVASMSIGHLEAEAGLVTGGGDLLTDRNNAVRFDPSTPTDAIVSYQDPTLASIRYFQIGFRTTNAAPFDVTSIAWSVDNLVYNSFAPNDFVNNIDSPTILRYSSIIDLGDTFRLSGSMPFYVRYTLPSGIEIDSVVQSRLRANDSGFVQDGVLGDNGGQFLRINRLHTAVVPEPTSMLLALTGVGLLGARRWLRRRSPSNGID
jgi:MYXO-CTERM domain-containing protein